MRRTICAIMIIVWTLTLMSGCNQSVTETRHGEETANSIIDDSEKTALLEGEALAAVLAENLSLPNVAALVDTLEGQGYSYRQTNSLVKIENHYKRVLLPSTGVVAKMVPDPSYSSLLYADTLVWQVFENAACDSSRHTALVTIASKGRKATFLQELDISQMPPRVLLLASVNEGIMIPADSGAVANVNDYWKEVAACCAGCAAGCAFSGPGWAACFGICCAACAVGAIVLIILDWLF